MRNPFRRGWKPPESWETKEEVKVEKVPGKLRYEILQEKDLRAGIDPEPILKTVVMKTGKIGKKKLFVDWQRRRFFINHILKETSGKKVRHMVRWNINYSEAMDAKGAISYSDELENLDMNDMMLQLKKAVGQIQGFILDRNTATILLFAMIFGIPIGFNYNPILHWIPNTVIHWVPR